MTQRHGLILIAISLCAIVAAIFARPQMMVAPGPLIPAHAEVSGNCFACHTPFQGASPDRCVACHQVADIGIWTTKGALIAKRQRGIAFHQALSQTNCMACHTDHGGPQLAGASKTTFAHEMLRPDVRGQCAACHRAPPIAIHAQAGNNCAQCHAQTAWKPASFDHARFFALTGPHKTACATCHVGGNFKRYTCYGCHEHQPDQIRAEHAEEGIRNIENCARCHQSASGEGGAGEREDD